MVARGWSRVQRRFAREGIRERVPECRQEPVRKTSRDDTRSGHGLAGDELPGLRAGWGDRRRRERHGIMLPERVE